MTYNEFMERAGCEKWPERWEGLFDEVREDFAYRGSPATDPSYYDYLENRYGIMADDLDTFKLICREVNKNDDLRLLLCLIVRAMKDRDLIYSDLDSFRMKKSGDIASRSFTALAALSMTDHTYALLKARGIPEDVIRSVLRFPAAGIRDYPKRHGGEIGYELLGWFQYAVDGRLFRIGRLEFELDAKFRGRGAVFSGPDGKLVCLADDLEVHASGRALGAAGCTDPAGSFKADIVETDDYYEGRPFLEDGRVSDSAVRLDKKRWKRIISRKDRAIGVHIPSGGGLRPELVDESIKTAREFFLRYFPDHPSKCFVCESWMMDPVLCGIVGENSNIARFNRRFNKITCKCSGKGVFHFVYLLGETDNVDYSTLDESTTLTRGIKKLYLNGDCVRETFGWFI